MFDATHQLILRLVGEGKVTGLRIDHPDGLYAPGEYFRRLQEGALVATARRLVPELGARARREALGRALPRPRRGPGRPRRRRGPLWIAAEKILGPDEPLPEWWAVAGTTGYDFLAAVNGLFVDRGTSRQMTALYSRLRGRRRAGMADLIYAAKRLIMQVSMASEINQLGHHLDRMSERNRRSRDFTLPSLARAIREVVAAFAVYRTYVGDDGARRRAPRDRGYIEAAVAEAKRRNPTVNVSIFDFVRDVLLLRHPDRRDPEERAARRHFAMRFQQITGPVTAKGVEDTALLRLQPPGLAQRGGRRSRALRRAARRLPRRATRARLARWPESLLATSTHDTKRGEDVRARINVLSEMPAEWAAEVRRWRGIARRFKRDVDGHAAPDRNDEYLLYQTLVGAWPARDEDEPLETLTARARRLHGEGHQGGQAPHELGEPERGLRRGDARLRDAACSRPDGPFLAAFRPVPALVAAHGRGQLARPRRCSSSPPRACPTSTRAPSCGTSRWSIPTTAGPVDFAAPAGAAGGARAPASRPTRPPGPTPPALRRAARPLAGRPREALPHPPRADPPARARAALRAGRLPRARRGRPRTPTTWWRWRAPTAPTR